MKVAIIGANSYIARNLLVFLKLNFPRAKVLLYDLAGKHLDGEENYHSIKILEEDSVAQMDLDCDLVFMFVGKTGSAAGFDEFETFIDINERALLHVLREYRKQKSNAKIIFPSTRLVYKGSPNPIKETDEKEFKTVYSVNKFSCEQYLEQFHRVFGIQYCIFRICVPYGTMVPGAGSYGTVHFMIHHAKKGENIPLYGTGDVRRTFTHIEDLCSNLLDGALCERCKNDVYNIGGENLSIGEVAELIATQYGVGIDYVDYPKIDEMIESGSTVFDADKLAALGIRPSRTIREWILSSDNRIDKKFKRGGGVYDYSVILVFKCDWLLSINKSQNFVNEHYSPN